MSRMATLTGRMSTFRTVNSRFSSVPFCSVPSHDFRKPLQPFDLGPRPIVHTFIVYFIFSGCSAWATVLIPLRQCEWAGSRTDRRLINSPTAKWKSPVVKRGCLKPRCVKRVFAVFFKLHRVSKTSHLWLAITLTHVNGFWYFLAEILLIK